MKKTLVAALALAFPLVPVSAQVMDDDHTLGQDVQEERAENSGLEREQSDAQVIERESKVIDSGSANIQEQQVERGSKDVEYKTKRRVTETLLKQEEIPTIQVCESKADINKMDANDFQALGFDSKTSQTIVDQRSQKGQFRSVEELSQIQGVSPDALAQVRDDLGVMEKQAQEE